MSKTKELREQLKSVIATALTSAGLQNVGVFYQKAKAPTNPYIVFNADEVVHDDFRTTYELEVNCMDYGTSTERCENIADVLQTAFDHRTFISTGITFNAYQNRRNTVQSEDENIIRRRLTFDIYLYERN